MTMKKNALINDIIGRYMTTQGFELKTDKKTHWSWSKKIQDIEEMITICDKGNSLQLLFGNGRGNCSYVHGDKLLCTIEAPRTKGEHWDYYRYEGNLEELYINILKDMNDIIQKNWKEVLEKQAELFKKHVPNSKHLAQYKESYECLAQEFKIIYEMQNKSVGEVFETVVQQTSLLLGKELAEVEHIILGLSAMLENTIMEQYGGIRKINKDTNVIILTRVGKTDRVLNILQNVFNWWMKPEYFEYSTDIFRQWINREETLRNNITK